MNTPARETVELQGFSPRIVSTLFIGDEQINVRETCDAFIVVEAARKFEPCDAVIQTMIGDEVDEFTVRLLDGIDPARDEQPIRILSED